MLGAQECTLCSSPNVVEFYTHPRWGTYFHCKHCDFRFLHSAYYVDTSQEEKVYKQHTNSFDDPNYIQFLSPTVDLIKSHVTKEEAGLDFGCGYSPLLATWLERDGYCIAKYDPMFFPEVKCLSSEYDYVIATEVIEHFKNPRSEFKTLDSLLKPKAKFIAMTLLYNDNIIFDNWHYRRDPTHVGFFSERSIQFLADNMKWDLLYSDNKRTFVFQKRGW